MDILSLKSNDYKALLIIKIIINYGIREGLAIKKLEKSFKKKNIILYRYKHFNLSITLNLLEYSDFVY